MNWKVALVPTDTVYGLLCRITDKDAIERIYELKGRDKSKPLILFGKSKELLQQYSDGWFNKVDALAHHYWPGPLTIILPREEKLPDYVNPGFDTVGMRVPSSKSVMDLLEQIPEGVLLSTSANISGEPEITKYEDALVQFGDKVDLLIEPQAGENSSGEASTVVKFHEDDMTVIRQGEVFVGV